MCAWLVCVYWWHPWPWSRPSSRKNQMGLQAPRTQPSARPVPVRLQGFSPPTRSSTLTTSQEYGHAAPAPEDLLVAEHARTVAIADTERTFPRLLLKERRCSMRTSPPTGEPWVQPTGRAPG